MLPRLLAFLEAVLKVACTVLLAVIVLCLSYAVLMRYLFHMPPAWSMEVSRLFFLWMVMFGAAVVTREQSHIQIQFVVDRLPRTLRFIWTICLRVMMIGFCWILVQQGVAILPMVSEAATPTLGFSMGWLYLSVPVGGTLFTIFILESLVASIRAYIKEEKSGEKQVC
jgi:TRAP-type C4-dicarboxylate transport system permease small subunit